jgi:flagellar motility protein MotE (MotC chaperone)
MNQMYLYVALVGVAFVLYALTRNGKQAGGQAQAPALESAVLSGVDQGDIKQTLDEFMNELEKDNARLLESFTQLQIEYKRQLAEQQEQIQSLERRLALLEKRAEEAMPPQAEVASVPVSPEPEPPQAGFAFNEKYAKVVELSNQGMSAEQIAKLTEIGLGEIHLVLGLAKREGQR